MSTHNHHAHHMMEEMNTTDSDMTSIPTTIASVLQAAMTTMISHDMHHHHSASGSAPSGHSMVRDESAAIPTVATGISDHYGHGLHASGQGNHEMMMYFHSSMNATILFKEWQISTMNGLIGSVIGIFLMAMLYEGLKYFREFLFKKYFTSLEYSSVSVVGDDGKAVNEVHKVVKNRMWSLPHITQTVLHMVQIVLSYFLMLIFMTYNIWLCLGVVLGLGVGYFLFGWKKATVVDITEHCH